MKVSKGGGYNQWMVTTGEWSLAGGCFSTDRRTWVIQLSETSGGGKHDTTNGG